MCWKKCRGNYELNLHVKRNHENVLLQCNGCRKKFKSENGLRYHMNKLHIVSRVVSNVVCDVCEKGFMNVQQLQDHQKITQGAKRLKCDMCNDEFLYYSSFCRHTRTETATKNYFHKKTWFYHEQRKHIIIHFMKQKNMIAKDVRRYLSIAHQSTITKKDALRKYSGIKL